MKKEDILQAGRKENQNKDIFELEIIRKGQRIGGLTAVCSAFVLMFLERVIMDRGINYGYLFIILSATEGMWIYKAVKLKRKHEILLTVIFGIMMIYAAVMTVLGFIGGYYE